MRAEDYPLSAQQPLNACHRPLDSLDKVVAGIQLEHRVAAFALEKSPDLLSIYLNCFQDWIACLSLLVPQREIDAVRPALRLVGEDVLFEAW